MEWILIAVLAVLMVMVLVSLVRGIVAFLQSTKTDLEAGDDGEGASEMQMRQNQAMFARIKYQGLAIVVVAILLALAR